MRNFRLFITAILALFCTYTSFAQEAPAYKPAFFISEGDTLPYRILFPQNFDPEKKYPLMLVLHGAGERGKDNAAQLTHGSNLFLKENVRRDFPAIVVFPQCPKNSFWSNVEVDRSSTPLTFNFQKEGEPTAAMKLLQGLAKELSSRAYINEQQLYVGGLSMGGMGTLELLRREPGMFAAAFAICGGDHVANAQKYKNVPLWLFHGSKDDVVPASYSENLAEKLEEIGAKNIKLTLYPDVKHNSWENAFAEPQLLPWLFSKKK